MRNINNKISEYRKMVLFVMFDVSTKTKKDLDFYRIFRKKLFELGFIMFQYSIYIRFCNNLAIALKYENKVQAFAPPNGSIRIIKITQAQYMGMKIIENYRKKPEEKLQEQEQTLMLF
jgi:CRISPR-associated protein Cas2